MVTVPPDNLLRLLGRRRDLNPKLLDEIDQRIRAGWVRFRRYKRELYDHPKVSMFHLKARMVKSEVCSRGSPVRMRDVDAL